MYCPVLSCPVCCLSVLNHFVGVKLQDLDLPGEFKYYWVGQALCRHDSTQYPAHRLNMFIIALYINGYAWAQPNFVKDKSSCWLLID